MHVALGDLAWITSPVLSLPLPFPQPHALAIFNPLAVLRAHCDGSTGSMHRKHSARVCLVSGKGQTYTVY